jgi:hypothetical protein
LTRNDPTTTTPKEIIMSGWVPTAVLLAYSSVVMLLALAGAFSETEQRRGAAFRVLQALLPWGLVAALAHAAINCLTGFSIRP